MKIVIFGLSISSAWGNGHATLLRGLFRALHQRGHEVHFFERDTPYYAAHRDASAFDYVHLHLYSDWRSIAEEAKRQLSGADAGMVTSYCADGAIASECVLGAQVACSVFYDMDTPVTLSRLQAGEPVPYLPSFGLADFDLVLSYTGGAGLAELSRALAAKNVAALYGWVDPDVYYPVPAVSRFEADLSYLGTYSADRQSAVDRLFLDAARQSPGKRFRIGGAMYPSQDQWPGNVQHSEHVAPPEHREFYCSSPVTLNVTRASMAGMGYCPSGRLFEASACGTAVLSDQWEGLDTFFTPGEEILIGSDAEDTLRVLQLGRDALQRVASRARERTLECHTADMRAQRLLGLIEDAHNQNALLIRKGA